MGNRVPLRSPERTTSVARGPVPVTRGAAAGLADSGALGGGGGAGAAGPPAGGGGGRPRPRWGTRAPGGPPGPPPGAGGAPAPGRGGAPAGWADPGAGGGGGGAGAAAPRGGGGFSRPNIVFGARGAKTGCGEGSPPPPP